MPTRKVSDRERLTVWARTADDTQLDTAEEIIRAEKSARKAVKGGPAPRRAKVERVPTVQRASLVAPKPANGPVGDNNESNA